MKREGYSYIKHLQIVWTKENCDKYYAKVYPSLRALTIYSLNDKYLIESLFKRNPNIEALHIGFVKYPHISSIIFWMDSSREYLKNMRTLKIGQIDDICDLKKILKCTPNLKHLNIVVAHIKTIDESPSEHDHFQHTNLLSFRLGKLIHNESTTLPLQVDLLNRMFPQC